MPHEMTKFSDQSNEGSDSTSSTTRKSLDVLRIAEKSKHGSSNLDHDPSKKARYEPALGEKESQAETNSGWDEWQAKQYGVKEWDESSIPEGNWTDYGDHGQAGSSEGEISEGERERIKGIINHIKWHNGYWDKNAIGGYLQQENINTSQKAKVGLDHLNTLAVRYHQRRHNNMITVLQEIINEG